MKSNRILFALLFGTFTFVLGLGAFYYVGGEMEPKMLIISGLVLLFVVVAVANAMRQRKDEKLGMPLEDERSLSIKDKAGSKAFQYSFYTWTAVMLFMSIGHIETWEMIPIGLAASVMLYGIFYYLESKKP